MVNGALNDITASRDFGLEQGDAIVEFVDRKGIEILTRELSRWVVLSAGQIVRVHAGKVGRVCAYVKRRGSPDFDTCGLDVTGCDPDSRG